MQAIKPKVLLVALGNFALGTGAVIAGEIGPAPTSSIPTLGEWGLAGIAALLAVAAGRVLYRRKP